MPEANWDGFIENIPGANFMQTEEWARIKAPVGWQPVKQTWPAAAALTLYRSFSKLPFSIAYVPRGPLVDWTEPASYQPVLNDLISDARRRGAIFLKIDPYLEIGKGIPGSPADKPNDVGLGVIQYLMSHGWRFSSDQIQFRNTLEIDLTASESEMLARMHQKTRYNIRLAEKKGVNVSGASKKEWPELYRLYAETANRDGFIIRPWEYYQRVWTILTDACMADCLKAEYDGRLIGAIWMVGFGKKAHYLYGMSSTEHREVMPNHLLQWRGMLMAKDQGREVYDMWGAPDEFVAADVLSGVFRFKQGFGGSVVRTLGAWDYPIQPLYYRLYTKLLPKILDIFRHRSREKTRQLLDS